MKFLLITAALSWAIASGTLAQNGNNAPTVTNPKVLNADGSPAVIQPPTAKDPTTVLPAQTVAEPKAAGFAEQSRVREQDAQQVQDARLAQTRPARQVPAKKKPAMSNRTTKRTRATSNQSRSVTN